MKNNIKTIFVINNDHEWYYIQDKLFLNAYYCGKQITWGEDIKDKIGISSYIFPQYIILFETNKLYHAIFKKQIEEHMEYKNLDQLKYTSVSTIIRKDKLKNLMYEF